MQESRRRRRVELGVLSVKQLGQGRAALALLGALLSLMACGGASATQPVRSGPRPEVASAALDSSAGRAASSRVNPEESAALEPDGPSVIADDLVFMVPEALPEGMKVLHIGDSFAGVLGRPLNRELARRGVRGFLEYQTGTYIATWASSKPVRRYVTRYEPDLVLITLGANELDVARPAARARLVRKLVRSLGERPCVWIAPPLWRGAKSRVLRVIEDNCAPCAYLDSTALVPDLERRKDAIHPSPEGGARWASAVIAWLEEHPPVATERRWVQLGP
jgi:lysophospholipase L1-like esterase